MVPEKKVKAEEVAEETGRLIGKGVKKGFGIAKGFGVDGKGCRAGRC